MLKHVMQLRSRPVSQEKAMAHAGGFDCPTQLVGSTKWIGADNGAVNVYVEPSTGAAGLAVAQNILSRMDDLMTYCDTVFGVKGKAGNVIICSSPFQGETDGGGGAYHMGCSFNSDAPGSDWYEDLATGNPDMTFGLVMAEVCESYMGLAGAGFNCGGSGGEGLSRFLAEIVSGGPNGALSAFASGPSWDGTDWISKDQGTDQDYPSIGCSILYMWWMTYLGYKVAQIIQAGEPDGSLASNYAALTGNPKTQAFTDFKRAVAAAGGPTSDNPWNIPTPAYPGTSTPPPPVPVLVTVPNVVGLGVSAAVTVLSADNLMSSTGGVSSGTVTAQSPSAGSQVTKGTTVSLTVASVPPPPPMTAFPDYDGTVTNTVDGVPVVGTIHLTPTPTSLAAGALLRDVLKLIADAKAKASQTVLLSDLQAILKDLGA